MNSWIPTKKGFSPWEDWLQLPQTWEDFPALYLRLSQFSPPKSEGTWYGYHRVKFAPETPPSHPILLGMQAFCTSFNFFRSASNILASRYRSIADLKGIRQELSFG